jgi:hypothetical protein
MADVWVFKTSRGEVAYQRADGSYYLQYADGSTKAFSEFELKRFVSSLADHKAVEDTISALEQKIGVKLPESDRKAMVARLHKQGRRAGLLRSSSPATKLLDK